MLRIANAAGFLGDWLAAPRRLLEGAEVDYLTLEYLAELTLSILARQRAKDPRAGYAGDFLDVLEEVAPLLGERPDLRIVTNAGGVNPRSCAAAAGEVLAAAGLGGLPLGVVTGDDLLGRLDALRAAGCDLAHLDTGAPLDPQEAPVVSANAYLGAGPIVEALAGGARIVITGRVADASLTVGPARHELGWKNDDWDLLAAGTVAGHLIECGAQATGGYRTAWAEHALADVGYPIAELEGNGRATITKPAGSGGAVTRQTVVEQLVYEIGDPAHYLTPDVDADFTAVEVRDLGSDRVKVDGARGRPAPESYKVSIARPAGFTASGQLLVYGHDSLAKARAAADVVRQRLRAAGAAPQQFHAELLGSGDGVPGLHAPPDDLREVVLRLTVADESRPVVERFARLIAPLITSGPAGLAGYTSGRPRPRPVLAYWPALVPRDLVDKEVAVEVRRAEEWGEGKAEG